MSLSDPPRRRGSALLRLLERYTKTDLTYLASGGFWLGLDAVAGGLVSFLLAIAFAHYLTKDAYGTYRFLIATFWILTAFTMTGLPAAVARAVTQGREGVYRSAFGYSILWGLPLTVLALGGSGYYFFKGNEGLGYGFLIIALCGPFIQAAYLWGAYFLGKKEFRALSLGGVCFALLPACVLFITMWVSPTPLALLGAYFVSSIVTGALIALYITIRYKPNRVSDTESRDLGKHFSAMNLLSTIGQQVDKLVVFHYLGAVELAVYALATALPEQIKTVFDSASTLALPKFVERPFAEIEKNFWFRLAAFTVLLALVAIAYIAVAPFVFRLFFPAYTEAVWYSQLYVLALIPIGNAFPVTLLQAQKAKRELYIYNTLSPVFQITALILLTSLYGLVGTIIARITARAWGLLLGSILIKTYAARPGAKDPIE